MESATWCRTPAAASAARRLRPEVSKNSSTALSSNEGELARSITTCVPAMASLRPSPLMLLTPVLGEAATTSGAAGRRGGTVSDPIRPVPPITTIFIPNLLFDLRQPPLLQDVFPLDLDPRRFEDPAHHIEVAAVEDQLHGLAPAEAVEDRAQRFVAATDVAADLVA